MTKKTTKEPAPTTPEEEKKEIKVIERIIDSKEIAPVDAFGKLTRSQIELIKRTVAKDASDDELKLFIQVCKGANLNPFLRQAHLVPYFDAKEGVTRRAIIVGIDGLRAVAESTGAYAGNDDPIFEGEGTLKIGTTLIKHPEKATVTVYKLVGGNRYPFTASARWSEYYPGDKKGYQWHRMPYLMLGKCAEALVLRKAFPKLLSGMYVAEEMAQVITDDNGAKEKKAADKLNEMIEKETDIKVLEDFIVKLKKSEKYTEAEKAEFLVKINTKINELKKR